MHWSLPLAYVAFLTNLIGLDGNPASGGLVDTYVRNTTTRTPVYTDVAGATPATNPVVANALGQVVYYFSDAAQYSWSATTADGATVLWEADVVGGAVSYTYLNDGLIQQFEEDATGNGTTTAYTISDVVLTSAHQLLVYIDGLIQPTTSYSVGNNGTDTTVTFSTAPLNGSAIYMRSFAAQGLTGPAGTPADMDAYTAWSAPDGELTLWGRTAGSLNRKLALGSGWSALINGAAASGVVMASGNQTGIAGNKTWTGKQTVSYGANHGVVAYSQSTPGTYNLDIELQDNGSSRWLISMRTTATDDLWFYNAARASTDLAINATTGVVSTPNGIDTGPIDVDGAQTWTLTGSEYNYASKVYSSATAELGDVFKIYHEVDSQLAANGTIGHAIRFEALLGSTTTIKGNYHTLGLVVDVEDADHVSGGVSEFTTEVSLLHAKSGFTNHNPNYWGCDRTIVGPTSGQEGFMGYVMMLTKRHAGTTIDATHYGAIGQAYVTRYFGGPANVSTTSYPMDIGVVVAGWSGASGVSNAYNASATNGWDVAFQAGGRGSPWMTSSQASKIGTGLKVLDHATYGVHITTRWSNDGAGTGATGNAIYVEQGGGGVGIWRAPNSAIPLTVSSGTGSLAARFYRSDDGAGVGPIVEFYRHSTTPANNDALMRQGFVGFDSGAGEQYYGYADVIALDVTAGSEDGTYDLVMAENGTLVNVLSARGVASGETSLLVRYNNGTSSVFGRVTVGVADSGGVGFRLLRVAN